MPSPFPGMNPFLEAPDLWPGFHNRLIAAISSALNRRSPKAYFADIEERIYVVKSDDPAIKLIIPDVSIREVQSPVTHSGSGAVAVATLTASPSLRVEMIHETLTETFLTIRAKAHEEIVTIIEILSPANKMIGSAGQTAYLSKRDEVLQSRTHFLEIDLLRAGCRRPMSYAYPERDYLVSLSRTEDRPVIDCWPVGLFERLPVVPVPLLPGDDDVLLDLQQILHDVHDDSGYVRRLNYAADVPTPALSTEQYSKLQSFVTATT
ncbi:MAG: DUF4058 family protein [Planctomycetaceae bacterium]